MEMSIKGALLRCSIVYDTVRKTTENNYAIDDKYSARKMKDGRWVILEIGKELFPQRGTNSTNDKFLNKCKFALYKWVISPDGFKLKEYPQNLIDVNTGDVLYNPDMQYY